MAEVITEKRFPVQLRWLVREAMTPLEYTLPGLLITFILAMIDLPFLFLGRISGEWLIAMVTMFGLTVVYFGCKLIGAIWARKNFRFSLDESYLTIVQGVWSKQQRIIPYEVIQDVIVTQTLTDKIFNLVTIIVENAAVNHQPGESYQPNVDNALGSLGAQVRIPGLSQENAKSLRDLLLVKIKNIPSNSAGL